MLYRFLRFCGKIIDEIIWRFYAEIHIRDMLAKIGEYKKKN